MENIWFAIASFLSAIACSIVAINKNREANGWFTLGLILWFLPLVILFRLPTLKEK